MIKYVIIRLDVEHRQTEKSLCTNMDADIYNKTFDKRSDAKDFLDKVLNTRKTELEKTLGSDYKISKDNNGQGKYILLVSRKHFSGINSDLYNAQYQYTIKEIEV